MINYFCIIIYILVKSVQSSSHQSNVTMLKVPMIKIKIANTNNQCESCFLEIIKIIKHTEFNANRVL